MALWAGGEFEKSAIRYAPGSWHEGRVTHDGTTVRLYLDGVEAVALEADLQPSDDPDFGNTHFGNGHAFKGYLARLKVYDGVVAP
jgi:hypothetical protein